MQIKNREYTVHKSLLIYPRKREKKIDLHLISVVKQHPFTKNFFFLHFSFSLSIIQLKRKFRNLSYRNMYIKTCPSYCPLCRSVNTLVLLKLTLLSFTTIYTERNKNLTVQQRAKLLFFFFTFLQYYHQKWKKKGKKHYLYGRNSI